MGKYNPAPYQLDLNRYPHLVTDTIPGPKSKELHARAAKYYRGLSGQVKLFPVAFERGSGCMLEDVDGNQYIDFSSGIYVTTLGHCHPKISEGVAKYAKQLMNAHDFTTEIKVRLLEKMASVLLVPRPDTYRPWWTRPDGTLDTERYLEFYDKFIRESTTGQVAAFVLEPIQGWGGSIMPPDDFFPKLRKFLDERNILLFADEVLTSMGRTGKILCCEHWNVLPDVVTMGKGFGNGFPVTCMAVRTPYADAVDKISASTSYGGNPMACAAALACFEVIEEEGLLEHAQELEVLFKKRMADWTTKYKIVGDTRCKGCLLGIELVKDKALKTPFDEAGKMVYQKAFGKGLAWVPAGHILRMSPPIIMPNEVALKGMDIIEEAIAETEKELLG